MPTAPAHARRRRPLFLVSALLARWSSWSFVVKPSSSISSHEAKSSCRLARHQFLASVVAGSVVVAPRAAWSEASEDEKKVSERLANVLSKIKERKKMSEQVIKPLQDQIKAKKAAYKQQIEPLQAQIAKEKKVLDEATKPLKEQIQKEKKAYKDQVTPLKKEVKDLEVKLKGLQREIADLDLKDELD